MRLKLVSLVATMFLLSSCATYVQSYNQYINGYWGEWNHLDNGLWTYKGNPDDFVIYHPWLHPSTYYFRVKIFGYSDNELKKNKEMKYAGTIEYQSRETKTIGKYDYKQQSLKFVNNPIEAPTDVISSGYTKRVATIYAYYKKGGAIVYNVWFDDVGLGLTIPW